MKHIYMGQKWKTSAQQLIAEIYSWFNSVKCYVQIGVQIMTHVFNLEDRNFRELFSMKFGLQKLWTLLSSSWSQKKTEVSKSKKNTIDSTQGRNWNWTLGILMRIQRDAIQLKALYTLKVFRVRHLCDITTNEIIERYYVKHWQVYPLNVYLELKKPLLCTHVNAFGITKFSKAMRMK